MVPSSRRHFLAGVGAAATAGLAGCLDAIPRFPKRVHNRDATVTPRTDGWRSKHGGSTRRSFTTGSLTATAAPTTVLDLDDWWKGQPVFSPNQLVIPVQLPPEGESSEPSFEGLLALDSASGVEQWRFAYDKPFTTPTVVGETVFVQGATTYALDRTDGSVCWEYRSGYGYAGTAPVFVDGVVAVIAARSRSIVGLDAQTGKQLWSTPLVREYPVGIASGSEEIYACTPASDDAAGEFVRIEHTSGEFEWRSEISENVSTPVVGSNRVYLWVGRQLVAFDTSTGEHVWAESIPTSTHSYPNIALDEEQCVTLSDDGREHSTVIALDATTGDRQWRGPQIDNIEFGPLAMNGTHVYAPLSEEPHKIGAIDRTNGEVVDRWALPGHPLTGITIDAKTGVVVTQEDTTPSVTILTE